MNDETFKIINTLHDDVAYLNEEIAFARQAVRIVKVAVCRGDTDAIETEEMMRFCTKVMDDLLDKAENTYGMSETFKREVATA